MSKYLPQHLPALDGLRGVAILMVVLTHAAGGWQAARSLTQNTVAWPATFNVPGWLFVIAGYSVHGVTLFFVISAFTLTLSMANRHDLARYALRRLARVGPGYWLAGICYTLAAGLAPRLFAPNGVTLSDLAVAATFGSAWQGGASLAVVPGGWSVSCEVGFYVVLPLVLWLIRGSIWRGALLTLTSFVIVQLAFCYASAYDGWHYVPQYVYPGVQAPVFLCGITAALIMQRFRLPALPNLAVGLLAFAVLVVPFGPVDPRHLLPHLVFAATVAVVVALSAQHPPRLLANAALRHVGRVSYSMYLIHFALLTPSLTVAEWLTDNDDWRTLALHSTVTATCSFALACLTFRWIEQPSIGWAGRLMQRFAPAAVVIAD
ncbi:MAG: acyltransferase [Oxalobacteraceae bacterium]|nr:MAG: acyltransferase [Oxalobacteraceae bacterium]